MCARLFGPRAAGRVEQIRDPLRAREAAFTALFVGQREIEVNVGVRGHGARGATQMADGFVDSPLLFQHAAQVVARDAAERVELHGGGEFRARVFHAAHLIERDAKIDVRVNPFGSELQRLTVTIGGLRQKLGVHFTFKRFAEKFLGGRAAQLMDLRGSGRRLERQRPLLFQRIERAIGPGRHNENVAALFEEAQLLQRDGRTNELLFDQADGAAHAACGDVILSETLKSAEGNEVAETVESLAPPCAGTDQPEPLPVTKTARFHSEDAAYFSPRVLLRQAPSFPLSFLLQTIMHPLSTTGVKLLV